MCLENNQEIIEILLWIFLWVFSIGLFLYLKKKGWTVVKDIECPNPKCKTTFWIRLVECPQCGKHNDKHEYWRKISFQNITKEGKK